MNATPTSKVAVLLSGRRLASRDAQAPKSGIDPRRIKDAQLSRQRNRHVENPSFFRRPLQGESAAKRSYVDESGDLHPFKIECFPTTNTDG